MCLYKMRHGCYVLLSSGIALLGFQLNLVSIFISSSCLFSMLCGETNELNGPWRMRVGILGNVQS